LSSALCRRNGATRTIETCLEPANPVERETLLTYDFASNFQSLSIHPAFRLDLCEPILSRRNSSQIFLNVLFSDIPDWNLLSVTVCDRHTKNRLAQEDSLSVVAQGAVTEVGKERLRLIKPVMNGQVIFGLTAKSLRTIQCVFPRVCHGQNSLVS